MFSDFSEEQRLVLINCVYFHGSWAQPFEQRLTKSKEFHAPSGNRQRSFMHMKSKFDYFEDERMQVVCLPYGGGSHLACWIFLPSRDLGLQSFIRQLEPSFWYFARANRSIEGELWLSHASGWNLPGT